MAAHAHLRGELREWPAKGRMATILRDAGFRISLGRLSIRLDDLSHFIFQDYGGYEADPQIEAEADGAELLLQEAGRVSGALAKAGIVHRFEIYEEEGKRQHYLHHGWPPAASS